MSFALLSNKSKFLLRYVIGIFFILGTVNLSFGADKQDLVAIMKQMRFEYNQAIKAESGEVMAKHLNAFKAQLAKAKAYPHHKDRKEKAIEGLNKVAQVIASIELPIENSEIESAKKKLAEIDQIKEQYHDKKVSLWERFYERIFGENEKNEKLILLD